MTPNKVKFDKDDLALTRDRVLLFMDFLQILYLPIWSGHFLFPSFPFFLRKALGFQSTIFSMFNGSPCHEVKFLQDGSVVKYFSVVDTYLPPWYLNGCAMNPLASLGQPSVTSFQSKKNNPDCFFIYYLLSIKYVPFQPSRTYFRNPKRTTCDWCSHQPLIQKCENRDWVTSG